MSQFDYVDKCHAEMIMRHQDTYGRLLYHQENYYMVEKASYEQEYCDSSLENTKILSPDEA